MSFQQDEKRFQRGGNGPWFFLILWKKKLWILWFLMIIWVILGGFYSWTFFDLSLCFWVTGQIICKKMNFCDFDSICIFLTIDFRKNLQEYFFVWILAFFHIYFKDRIARIDPNVALIMLFQYLKRNPAFKLYYSIFWQKTKFRMPITIFEHFFLKNRRFLDKLYLATFILH